MLPSFSHQIASSSSYYVAVYVNGTAVTPFTKGKATYLKTLPAGLYKVTAHSNSSGILNVTYYERVTSSTVPIPQPGVLGILFASAPANAYVLYSAYVGES